MFLRHRAHRPVGSWRVAADWSDRIVTKSGCEAKPSAFAYLHSSSPRFRDRDPQNKLEVKGAVEDSAATAYRDSPRSYGMFAKAWNQDVCSEYTWYPKLSLDRDRQLVERALSSPMIMGEEDMDKLPFVDRDDVIAKIVQDLEKKWNLPAGKLGDKNKNPLIGFQAVSGGGKSYMLDELLRLKFDSKTDKKRFAESLDNVDAFAAKWKQTLKIAITLNKKMENETFADKPEMDLASRILFSYFFSESGLNYSAFVTALQKNENSLTEYLSVYQAIAIIMDHAIWSAGEDRLREPRLILAIDEVIKSPESAKFLTAACSNMQSAETFGLHSMDVVSTTLYPSALEKVHTASNRLVLIYPLTPLWSFTKLFKSKEDRVILAVALRFPGVFCLNNLNSEWNIYEKMNAKLNEEGEPMTDADKNDVLKKFLEEFQVKHPLPNADIPPKLIFKALANQRLKFRSKEEERQYLVDYLIMNPYKKSLIPQVPLLSVFHLQHFADLNDADAMALAVKDLLEQYKVGSGTGVPFELFHLNWERLACVLLKYEEFQHELKYNPGKRVVKSLDDYYKKVAWFAKPDTGDLQMQVVPVAPIVSFPSKTLLKQVFENDFLKVFKKGSPVNKDSVMSFFDCKAILHAKKAPDGDNTAFDGIRLVPLANDPDTKLIVHYETRFSHPLGWQITHHQVLTRLNEYRNIHWRKDVVGKLDKLEKGYKKLSFANQGGFIDEQQKRIVLPPTLCNQFGCKYLKPILVVATPRTLGLRKAGSPKTAPSPDVLPTPTQMKKLKRSFVDTVVLHYDTLKHVYGPTLTHTHWFMSFLALDEEDVQTYLEKEEEDVTSK